MPNLKKYSLQAIAQRTVIVYSIVKVIGKRQLILRNFDSELSAFDFFKGNKYIRFKIKNHYYLKLAK